MLLRCLCRPTSLPKIWRIRTVRIYSLFPFPQPSSTVYKILPVIIIVITAGYILSKTDLKFFFAFQNSLGDFSLQQSVYRNTGDG